MKSSRLSFNSAIAKNTIRRYWPMWVAYLCFLSVTFPLPLLSELQNLKERPELQYLCREQIAHMTVFQGKAGFIAAILAVMILFGFLYNNRGITLMNSIPVRRETVFWTQFLTGLAPMLFCQLLVMAITLLITQDYRIEFVWFFGWFACAALSLISFFGFASFCAMLTGNIFVLLAVYVVLNFTAFGFETCIRKLLSILIYGMTPGQAKWTWLSPIVKISDNLKVLTDYPDSVQIKGIGVLAVYAATGICFAVLADLLYQKRKMETVSDFVAIPILKPIFRYCMGFGMSFLFSAIAFEYFFRNISSGSTAAWTMVLLLILGAFLGWIIAEMMIRRTLRVFPLRWKDLTIIFAVCAVMVLIAEEDITGYEKRVPNPKAVKYVEFCEDTVLAEQENIVAVTEIHMELIKEKRRYERKNVSSMSYIEEPSLTETHFTDSETYGQHRFMIPIQYVMRDGSTLQRIYTIQFRDSDVDHPESTIGRIIAILNTQEGIQSRMKPSIPMEERYVNYAVINRETKIGMEMAYRLTPQETVELWKIAMLPDAEEGHLCLYTIADTEKNMKTQTSLYIDISLFDESRSQEPYYWSHSYRVFTFSKRCLAWLDEHTDLEWERMTAVTTARDDNDSNVF